MKAAGIDFGARMAGTTVICAAGATQLEFHRAPRGVDADEFILSWVGEYSPMIVGIDAPLSLPGRYRGLPQCEDYFYRACDRELGAMSPMFLGGMTARAMRLCSQLRERGVRTIEVYPAALVRHFDRLKANYTPRSRRGAEDLRAYVDLVTATFNLQRVDEAESWHDIDALLSYVSVRRHLEGQGAVAGDSHEGLIHI
jgi:predicted nuclease with RNAse H fold